MRKMLRQTCRAAIVVFATVLGSHASFSDKDAKGLTDQDRARGAYERGEILPLQTVLLAVSKAVPGEVVGIELEQVQGRWLYEIKVIAAGGTMIEVYADARTAKVLRTKGE